MAISEGGRLNRGDITRVYCIFTCMYVIIDLYYKQYYFNCIFVIIDEH
jgi:hypothetical protein